MADRCLETAEAVAVEQPALPRIFDPRDQISAPLGEIGASKAAHAILGRIALFVDAGEARQLHAVEIVLEDDIDGARDRIRAIYGCAADRDGFDQIGRASGRARVCQYV